jgi:uncharacterized phage protein (TIGR01671 family)
MRELRFRAWDGESMELISDLYWFEESGVHDSSGDGHHRSYKIMQFTGLKDCNGVDIYEGDIVDFTLWWFDGNVAESHLIGSIVYTPNCMSYSLAGIKNKEWLTHIGGDSDIQPFSEFNFDEADFEVIGNIHETPELISGATNTGGD